MLYRKVNHLREPHEAATYYAENRWFFDIPTYAFYGGTKTYAMSIVFFGMIIYRGQGFWLYIAIALGMTCCGLFLYGIWKTRLMTPVGNISEQRRISSARRSQGK